MQSAVIQSVRLCVNSGQVSFFYCYMTRFERFQLQISIQKQLLTLLYFLQMLLQHQIQKDSVRMDSGIWCLAQNIVTE